MRALVGFFVLIGVYISTLLLPLFMGSQSFVDAATDPKLDCVRVKLPTGDATWYKPGVGYKGGSGTLATGGPYSSRAFAGALQLDLAKKYRCGYGAGKTCYAGIRAPSGQAILILINDNGPMCADSGVRCPRGRYQRIIDLTPKAFQALGGGGGVIRNVDVTLLCEGSGGYVGPLNESSRVALASATPLEAYSTPPQVDSPYSSWSPSSPSSPFSAFRQFATKPFQQLFGTVAPEPITGSIGSGYDQLTQYFEPPQNGWYAEESDQEAVDNARIKTLEALAELAKPEEELEEKGAPIFISIPSGHEGSLVPGAKSDPAVYVFPAEDPSRISPTTFASYTFTPVATESQDFFSTDWTAFLDTLVNALKSLSSFLPN